MAKQLHSNESPLLSNFGADLLSSGRAQTEAVVRAQQDLLKQFEVINRSVLDSIQKSTGSMSEFARRLPECGNPGEAAALYNEWLTQQMDNMFTESRRFADLWLSLCDTAMKPLQAAAAAEAADAPAVSKELSEKRTAARA